MLLIYEVISWFSKRSPDLLIFYRNHLIFYVNVSNAPDLSGNFRIFGAFVWSLDILLKILFYSIKSLFCYIPLKSPDLERKAELTHERARDICRKFWSLDFALDFLTVFGIGSRTYFIVFAETEYISATNEPN